MSDRQYPTPDKSDARCTYEECPMYNGRCVLTGEDPPKHCEPYVLWLIKSQKDGVSKYFIPDIDPTDAAANDLYIERINGGIKPLIIRDDELFYIEHRSAFDAFGWGATVLEMAEDVVVDREIRTLHACAYYGFFKPSIDEVIRQLPEDVDDIVAFSVKGPDTRGDMEKEWASVEAGFHVAVTTLYRKR